LYALELPILMDVEVYQQACDLSATLTQHVFDTLYHAVALHESGAFLVTADERYYRAAHRIGQIIKLKDFAVPTL
jgi:predicted nucleic acid-binding protein